jgi:hypothetical protein
MPAYSFSWALDRVYELKKKYARATDIVCKALGCKVTGLAAFLAVGDPIYPQIRTFIHIIDKWIKKGPDHYTDVEWIATIRLTKTKFFAGTQAERLDSRIKEVKLKEQAFQVDNIQGDLALDDPLDIAME